MRVGTERDIPTLLAGSSPLDAEDHQALYEHYKPALVRYATRERAPDPEGVADLALLDGFAAHPRLEKRTEQAFRSYLFRAARSHLIAEVRRNRAVPIGLIGEESIVESPADAIVEADWLRGLVEQLPPDQQAVIECRFIEDLSVPATAERLGKRPNAIHQLQHRALRRLRNAILAGGLLVAVALLIWFLGQQNDTQHRLVDQSPVGVSTDPTSLTASTVQLQTEAELWLVSPTTVSAGRATIEPAGGPRQDAQAPTTRDTAAAAAPVPTTDRPITTAKPSTTTIRRAADRPPSTTSTTVPATSTPPPPRSSTTSPVTSSPPQPTSSTTAPVTSGPPAPTYSETCRGRPATIVGSGVIHGTDGPDVIVGSNGPDVIFGLGGDDTICGGNGRDEILGGPGADTLSGGNGRDKLSGGPGDDRLIGGTGRDDLDGGPGADTVIQDG